jgi:nitrite reductase (NADH) large subunit
MNPIVVIGNGVASVAAVEAFRKYDKETPIIIFSDEPYHAYYRLRLSSLIGDTLNLDKLYIRKPEWYRELNIQVRLDNKVIGIDTEKKSVVLENGDTVFFSKLLIASGSSPFVPPVPGADLPGVFSIRSLDDVKRFNDYIANKNQGAVIGGGLLGLETAWALAKKGKKVHVIEGAPYILFNQLDEVAAKLLADLGKKASISFTVGGRLNKIVGNSRVSEIHLADGQIMPVDFVVFATGVRPNIDLVNSTPILSSRGILVDELMRTSVEDVYAAGDIAEYKGRVYGIWPVAQEQGKTAGLNMAGEKTSYNEIVPSNYLKVFDVEVFSVGDLCKEVKADATMKTLSEEDYVYRVVFFRDNTPVGAILFGDTKPATKIAKAIKLGIKIPDNIIRRGDFQDFLNEISV